MAGPWEAYQQPADGPWSTYQNRSSGPWEAYQTDVGDLPNHHTGWRQTPMAQTEEQAPTKGSGVASPINPDAPPGSPEDPATWAEDQRPQPPNWLQHRAQEGRDVLQAAREGWDSTPPLLGDKAQDWLDRTGLGGITHLGNAVLGAGNAAFRGAQEVARHTLEDIGLPARAARDVAALPEAFPLGGHELGVPTPEHAPSPSEAVARESLTDIATGQPERAPPAMPTLERMAVEAQADLVKPGAEAPAPEPAPATPSVEPGHVRFYHGGQAYDGGPRWLTPDLRYATGYADRGSDSFVHYVDVPENYPLLSKSFEDEGTDQRAPYVHFEAPEELARQLRPYREAAPEPVSTRSDAAPAVAPEPTEVASEPAAEPTETHQGHGPSMVYQMRDPESLTLDPSRFQYKEADNRGVTGALRGTDRWEPSLANPITAWEDTDGTAYVVNGHQRTDLALRANAAGQPDVQVPTRVFRAEDGYTPEFMRALGAYQNIAEGSGTALDAARILRGADALPESMRLPDLPPRSTLVRQAEALKHLDDRAFGMVENGIVPPEYAAPVGELIRDPTEQVAALDAIARAQPSNAQQARLMVQDIRNSGFLKGAQTTLFGDEAFARSLLPERARVLDQAMRVLRRTAGTFRAAVEGEETLAGAGNKLSTEANKAARTDNERILDYLQRDATTKGPLSEALSVAAGDLADGKPVARVTSDFLTQARKLERSGEAARGAAGAPVGGEGRTGEGRIDPGTDLLGQSVSEPATRTPEPTIRTDTRQAAIPGTEASAVQAQAARDAQGRGALQSDVPQRPANEGLFAPDESGQGKLYSFPAVLFDPDAWKRVTPALRPITRAATSVVQAAKGVADSIANGLAPMRTGTVRSRAFAADFANSLRQVMYRYGEIDREIEKRFTPAERDAMGRALDAQSVFEQQVRQMPADQQAAARAEFDGNGTGLAGLNPNQRHVIDMLDTLSRATWERMRARGMVSPDAEPLPYYMPRQIVMWSDAEGFTNASGGQGGGGRGIEPIGRNLTTAGPMRREHLTPEETEAAARAKLGNGAQLLRDIRSLPARLAFSEKAIAGVDLMDRIGQVGRDIGVDLVVKGDIPGLLHPGEYFTIADHPSFRRWAGSGWQAVHVAKEFEGPLKAVLTKPSPGWYRAAQGLKGGVMSAIMYSPFIHLAVELGRTLPVMPGKVLSFQWMKQGSMLRRDLGYMDQAIRDGIAPLGHSGGWSTDPASLADQAFGQERGAFVRALQGVRDAAANGARAIGGETLHDIVQHPHTTLLWDRVFDLQMSIYDTMRGRYIEKGFTPDVAGTMAAHIANRFAGALPAEHLSKAANMAANLLLFSRSFTLGNLGVMKDAFTGAPPHVLARIEQMAGPEVMKSAKAALQRKAVAAVAMDIGLFTLGIGLLQSGIQAIRQGVDETVDQWLHEAQAGTHDLASGNPLGLFKFLPQYWNEPGKQDRIYAGTDAEGRGVYLRLPPGKVGEEFVGWWAKPGTMLVNKASPIVRPILEDIMGHDSLGRQLFPPNPQTAGDYAHIAWLAVKHIGESMGPTSTIEGAAELARHHLLGQPAKGDPGVSALKIIGPLTGLAQVSSGYPGGPAAGEIHAQGERLRYEQQQAFPALRDKIKSGDQDGAIADMGRLGMRPWEIRNFIRQTLHPGPSAGAMRRFNQTATPEERSRVTP